MIAGFEKFEESFAPYRDSFILIGGTAVQMVLGQYDTPKGVANRARVTHDIDLLVVTDKLTDAFKTAFHRFVNAGEYECYFSKDRPHYYRFLNPKNVAYPAKIELLSHSLLELPNMRYTPLDWIGTRACRRWYLMRSSIVMRSCIAINGMDSNA